MATGHNAVGDALGSIDSDFFRMKIKSEPVPGLTVDVGGDYSRQQNGGEQAVVSRLFPPAASGPWRRIFHRWVVR